MNLSGDRRRSIAVLWGIGLFCLLPFLLLSLCNLMTIDDYVLYKSLRDRGWLASQGYMFGWTGRYTAIFAESLLLEAGAAHLHFLHTWLLLAGTWGALYFLLIAINTCFLNGRYNRSRLLLAAAILLLLFFYVQAEIASSLYWFSAAIPYQLAFILFLILGGCLIRRFYLPPKSPKHDITIAIVVLLITGCNEIAATFLVFLLLALLIIAWRSTRSLNRSLLFYLLIAIAAALFTVVFSGLFQYRYKIMRSGAGYQAVFPIILFRAFSVFYFILKLPLFWIIAFSLYLAGLANPLPPHLTRPATPGKVLISGLMAVTGLTLLTLSAITLVTRGPLPQRALNNLIDLTALGLLALFFLAGALRPPDPRLQPGLHLQPASYLQPSLPFRALPLLLICTMIAADPVADAWQSCFSGYFYVAAEKARENEIRLAAASREKIAILPPFFQSLDQEVRRVFPHGTFATVHDWLQTSPPFLYFAQHTEDAARAYGIYCGVDSVIIQKIR